MMQSRDSFPRNVRSIYPNWAIPVSAVHAYLYANIWRRNSSIQAEISKYIDQVLEDLRSVTLIKDIIGPKVKSPFELR